MSTPVVNLGYYPRDWQRRVHTQRKRFNVFALHRRAGKTEAGIMQLIDDALQFQQELGFFAYIAPFLKQAKAIAWVRLKQKLGPLIERGVVIVNESELSVRFRHNGAIIRLFGADNADALRGLRLDGVIMDEVAQMDPEVWEQIVQPTLADRKGWAWFIGTPNGVNLFSELYYGASRDPANWFAATFTCYDTNALDPEEVERLRQSMSTLAFAREMLCSFEAAGDDQLISLGDVIAAQKRQLRPDQYSFSPVVMGIDPAQFGGDRSAIVIRQGVMVRKVWAMPGIGNEVLISKAIELAKEYQVDAIFCDEAYGQGVILQLKTLGYPIIGIHFGSSPSKPIYKNKRAQMWCEVADLLPMMALPDGGDYGHALRQDLAAPTYLFDMQGRKQIESKDDMRERGIPSPDIGDALALTFAQPVEKKTPQQQWFEAQEAAAQRFQPEYDPYASVTTGVPVAEYDPYSSVA